MNIQSDISLSEKSRVYRCRWYTHQFIAVPMGKMMIHQWSWSFSQPFKTNPHIVSVYSNLEKDAEKCQVQFQNSIVD
jgi:hypothetical protein